MAPDLYADWEDRAKETGALVREDRLRLRLVCDDCPAPLLARALPTFRQRLGKAAQRHTEATGHHPRIEENADG